MSNNNRRERLDELSGQCVEIYDEKVKEAILGERQVLRYALLTCEPGHEGNPNLTMHETREALVKAATAEANEWPAWLPVEDVAHDLETGEEIALSVETRVTIA